MGSVRFKHQLSIIVLALSTLSAEQAHACEAGDLAGFESLENTFSFFAGQSNLLIDDTEPEDFLAAIKRYALSYKNKEKEMDEDDAKSKIEKAKAYFNSSKPVLKIKAYLAASAVAARIGAKKGMFGGASWGEKSIQWLRKALEVDNSNRETLEVYAQTVYEVSKSHIQSILEKKLGFDTDKEKPKALQYLKKYQPKSPWIAKLEKL